MSEKSQKAKWRRFCFFLLSVNLIIIGAYANAFFHVEERLSGVSDTAAGREISGGHPEQASDRNRQKEDIRETLAGGKDRKAAEGETSPGG